MKAARPTPPPCRFVALSHQACVAQGPRGPHRRGTVYLVVLSTVTLVIILSVAAAIAARIGVESANASIDAALARRVALSGIDLALSKVDNTLPARDTINDASGVVSDTTYDGVRLVVSASDPEDGDITGRTDQDLLLTSSASVRRASQKFQVRLTPYSEPISALSKAVSVGGRITFDSVWFRGIGEIWAGENVTASSSTIQLIVRSHGVVSGSTYSDTTQSSADMLVMPDPDDVESALRDYATPISFSSIPSSRIDGRLISAASNPFGAVNSSGIYIVDIGPGTLRIRDTRIIGTLLVITSGLGKVVIEESVCAEPFIEGYPCLVVIGDVQFDGSGADLKEATENVNYNPFGSPFEGVVDSDKTDSYGSVLKGIVYVSDDLDVNSNGLSVLGTLIVGDDASFRGRASAIYQSWEQAAPGFGGGRWKIEEPTWKRTLN